MLGHAYVTSKMIVPINLLGHQYTRITFKVLFYGDTWMYLFESCMRLFNKYTRRNVINFNKPKLNSSLHAG